MAQIFHKLDTRAHPTAAMVFDTLARRTVFSKLGKGPSNLVLEFHGGTMFGSPPLTPETIELLQRYRHLWTHFSHTGINRPLFTIKFPFDTLEQKCTTLKHLRDRPDVNIDHAGMVINKFQEIVISCVPYHGEKEVKLIPAQFTYRTRRGRSADPYRRGVWKRVADLREIEIEFG